MLLNATSQTLRTTERSIRPSIKHTFDADTCRRRRADETISLRRLKREEHQQQRRRLCSMTTSSDSCKNEQEPLDVSFFTSSVGLVPSQILEAVVAPPAGVAGQDDTFPLGAATRDDLNKTWIPKAMAALHSQQISETLRGMTWLRKILSVASNPCIDLVVDHHGLKGAMFFLRHPASPPELQFECAWVLTNIASGASCYTELVIQHGFLDTAMLMCKEFTLPPLPLSDEKERQIAKLIGQLAWAIGNIAGDGLVSRKKLIQSNWIEILLNCLQRLRRSSLTSCTDIESWGSIIWALSNLYRDAHQMQDVTPVDSNTITTLSEAVSHTFAMGNSSCQSDNGALYDASWLLSYMTMHMPDDVLDRVAVACSSSHVITLCTHMLQCSQQRSLHAPLLRFVGNLCSGSIAATQVCLDAHLPAALFTLLSPAVSDTIATNTRKEAYWIISNLAAGSSEQLQLLFDHRVLYCVAERWSMESQPAVLREILFVWDNILENSTINQCGSFMQQYLPVVLQACTSVMEHPDVHLVQRVLSILRFLLVRDVTELAGRFNVAQTLEADDLFLERLEQMQMHMNDDIYKAAQQLLSDFFCAETDDHDIDDDTFLDHTSNQNSTQSTVPFHFQQDSSATQLERTVSVMV